MSRRYVPQKQVLYCYCWRIDGPHEYRPACEDYADTDDPDLETLPAWQRSMILREREAAERQQRRIDAYYDDTEDLL